MAFETLNPQNQVECLIGEIAQIYILLKERSRPTEKVRSDDEVSCENRQIREMDVFTLIEYTRCAIELLFLPKVDDRRVTSESRSVKSEIQEQVFSPRVEGSRLESQRSSTISLPPCP